MMTPVEFHKRSKKVFSRGRSDLIRDIEAMLGQFHATQSYNRKMRIAALIYCETLLYTRGKPKGGRKKGVNLVQDQAREFLDSGYSLMMLDQKVNSGLSTKGGNASFKYGGKGLDSDYKWEVILPNKRIVSKMGSNLESVIGDENYFGMSDFDHSAIKGFKKPTQALDALINLWMDPDQSRKFLQANSQDRVNHQLIYDNGTMVWAGDPTGPYTSDYCACSNSGGDSSCLKNGMKGNPFAMDLDGNIYIWGGASVGSINDYNHSSFLSGKPVLCAGMIHLQQGRIVGVNNASGHYKPTRRELAKCVQTLLQTYRQSPIALWAYDKSNEHEEPMMAAMFQRKYGIG